jgi:acetyl esterase
MPTTVSPQPMAQPMRALLGLVGGLLRLRVMPGLESVLAKPHDVRLGSRVPKLFHRPPNASILTEDVLVVGRGGKIPVRIYKRPGTPDGAPGYLFIHGGGFVDGGVEHCDHVCRDLAERSGFVVVGLSYRLAPQHPFPAGIEDCQDVLTWMVKESPGDMDGSRLAVGGESAGGTFATSLAIWARDHNGPEIAHVAAIYPLADFTLSRIAWEEGNRGNPGVTREICEHVRRLYLPNEDFDNPEASVLFAKHDGLPPTLVVTCGHDVLRNEGIALADSLEAAGIETKHVHFADMPHGFLLMTKLTKRAHETMDLMIAEAARRL